MHQASQLTTAVQNKIASQPASQTRTTPVGQMDTASVDQQIKGLVNQVFTRLEAIFPRTWRLSFTTDNMLNLAKREVALSMARWSTLPTSKGLSMAIERIKDSGAEWPPSLPKLLVELKPQPADYGLPSPDKAWNEASQNAGNAAHRWSHDCVRKALVTTGSFDVCSASSGYRVAELRKLFIAHYEGECNRFMNGGAYEPAGMIGVDDAAKRRETEQKMRDQEALDKARREIADLEKQFGKAPTDPRERLKWVMNCGMEAN